MKFKIKKMQIACDGGAATGKSTGAKMISKKFNLKFLSSGLLYRYAAYMILKKKPKDKISFLKNKFKKLSYRKLEKMKLHSQQISVVSAKIAKMSKVREILKKYQLTFSKKNKRCCIEGRDIATKILPNSEIKFFFICNLRIASKRRYEDLKKNNSNLSLSEVKNALRMRNKIDVSRKNSPLLKHRDSVVIDTGKLNKKAMLTKMSKHINSFLNKSWN